MWVCCQLDLSHPVVPVRSGARSRDILETDIFISRLASLHLPTMRQLQAEPVRLCRAPGRVRAASAPGLQHLPEACGSSSSVLRVQTPETTNNHSQDRWSTSCVMCPYRHPLIQPSQ